MNGHKFAYQPGLDCTSSKHRAVVANSAVLTMLEIWKACLSFTGRLIRQRYRKASELSRHRGKLSCLLINDIDAGIGHFENTQITVSVSCCSNGV